MFHDTVYNKEQIRLFVFKNTFVSGQPNLPSQKRRKINKIISFAEPGRNIEYVVSLLPKKWNAERGANVRYYQFGEVALMK